MVGALLGWLSYINIIQKMSFNEETEKLKHQPPVENLTFHFVFQKDIFLVLSFYSLIVPEHFRCSLQQKKKTKSRKLKNQLHITRICASSIACLLDNLFFRCLLPRKCFGTVPQWKTKNDKVKTTTPPAEDLSFHYVCGNKKVFSFSVCIPKCFGKKSTITILILTYIYIYRPRMGDNLYTRTRKNRSDYMYIYTYTYYIYPSCHTYIQVAVV